MFKNRTFFASLLLPWLVAQAVRAATAPTYTPGPSSGKVSNAPGQVTPSVVPSGPDAPVGAAPAGADYNPANDNPGLYAGLPAQMPEGLMQAPETFWTRDTLFGDVAGLRDTAENYGFSIAPVYTGEVMGNLSGGARQGVVYDHSLNLPLTVYLDKIADGWDGATLHANLLWLAGRSLSADKVGDLGGTSNIAGYPTLRLQELWFQQAFWNMRASVKVGLIAADAEFFTSDTSSLFLNGTFGAFTLVGANLPNLAVYPMAAPAVCFLIQPVPAYYFQSGVYGGNTGAQDENKSGLDFHFTSNDGALVFTEIGYLLNQAAGDRGLVGNYKLGSFVHSGHFADWNTGASKGGDVGFYGVIDQEIYKHAGKAVAFFTRLGEAPANVNTVSWYFDGGLNFSGFIPGRINDTAGLAFARSSISGDFSDSQVSAGARPFTAENVIEATYKAQISPWWTLQPDFQYIITPSGEKGSKNAAVVGFRTMVVF